MSVSRMDDYPVHQIAEPVRHVATSDRNFYDRYYFNLHNCSDGLFVIMGLGQYPNLSVQDAFACVRRADEHRVVRASRTLGDRMDTSVGPIRIEVLEGLRRLRFVVEPNEHGIEMDVTWTGSVPAVLEPRHFRRAFGRVTFDTSRFAQTGTWEGSLVVGSDRYEVTPDRWWGARDRSWGVRPVGEPEPPGIRASGGGGRAGGMWNYVQARFDDFSVVYIVEEDRAGNRSLEEGVRVWSDESRPVEPLGRPEHAHVFRPGTREVERSTLSFESGLRMETTLLLPCHLSVGTGYGGGPWGHGTYHGDLAVEGDAWTISEHPERFRGLVDAVARFECEGRVGYGLFEYAMFGAHDRYFPA